MRRCQPAPSSGAESRPADDPADGPGCLGYSDRDEEDPPEPPVCKDGVDNDGDGVTDFPDDRGCTAASDTHERERSGFACDNGVDDDGDGATDYPDDGGCDSSSDPFGE